MMIELRSALAFMVLATAAAVDEFQPSMLKALPFTKIADEIYQAEQTMRELQWKVGNSTQEKGSLQWFMATAMKELTQLTKVVMNTSSEGSLANQMQLCTNRTTAPRQTYNKTKGLKRCIELDKNLAPKLLEYEMYKLYANQVKLEELKKKIGKCQAKCPISLISQRGMQKHIKAHQAQTLDNPELNPQELMGSISRAIYNTSETITTLKDHLIKDTAAKDVLNTLTATVMGKLLQAKKGVAEIAENLETCKHVPDATHVIGATSEVMGDNPEVAYDLVKTAQERTSGSSAEVKDIHKKWKKCLKKCDRWSYDKHDWEDEEALAKAEEEEDNE